MFWGQQWERDRYTRDDQGVLILICGIILREFSDRYNKIPASNSTYMAVFRGVGAPQGYWGPRHGSNLAALGC